MIALQILPASEKTIKRASQIVRAGGVIAYPTDTSYGLGCDPFNGQAVGRVTRIKGARTKPMPILGNSIASLSRVCNFSERALRLSKVFWPGPLTMVLPAKPIVSESFLSESGVGVRIPDNPVALEIITFSGGLLTGTSANLTGGRSPRTAEEAAAQVGEAVDMLVDGGKTKYESDSTVLDFVEPAMRMIRLGPISLREIELALTQTRFP